MAWASTRSSQHTAPDGDMPWRESLRLCLLNAQRASPEQGTGENPSATFSFVPADSKIPNARVLLVGSLKSTGSHAGPSPAETGEGRKSDPTVLEVSSDESED